MNRELRFRGWCKTNKEMVQIQKISFKNNKVMPYKWNIAWDIEEFEIMEYTGLVDSKGVDIFEGDILQTRDGLMVVEYNQDRFECINSVGNNFRLYDYIYFGFTKVIGNIYESKNLLEDAKC